jgi:hypothetical protein
VRRYIDERARPPLDHDSLADPDLTERARSLIGARRAATSDLSTSLEYIDHIAPELIGGQNQKSVLTPPATVRIYC